MKQCVAAKVGNLQQLRDVLTVNNVDDENDMGQTALPQCMLLVRTHDQ
jgi:hypothetical protein